MSLVLYSQLNIIFLLIIKWELDELEGSITPESDDAYYPLYTYIITVETGLRQVAGTKSNAYICIKGNYADTGSSRLGQIGKVKLYQSGNLFVYSS